MARRPLGQRVRPCGFVSPSDPGRIRCRSAQILFYAQLRAGARCGSSAAIGPGLHTSARPREFTVATTASRTKTTGSRRRSRPVAIMLWAAFAGPFAGFHTIMNCGPVGRRALRCSFRAIMSERARCFGTAPSLALRRPLRRRADNPLWRRVLPPQRVNGEFLRSSRHEGGGSFRSWEADCRRRCRLELRSDVVTIPTRRSAAIDHGWDIQCS